VGAFFVPLGEIGLQQSISTALEKKAIGNPFSQVVASEEIGRAGVRQNGEHHDS
jgi:hypothetical protein